jgi:hypothetical protein
MLVTSILDENINWIYGELSKVFKKVKISRGDLVEFVSLEISQKGGQIDVRMDKYIRSLLDEWQGTCMNETPARSDLFKRDGKSIKVTEQRSNLFRRRVARLLYLAKRVAPEILLSVSHLTSVVNDVREQDLDDLERIYCYLNGNTQHVIQYWRGAAVDVCIYIDASHGTHHDRKGRTGTVLMCAGGLVGAWSAKQPVNTISSTEAELIGLTSECTWVIWARNWLGSQGYRSLVSKVYQDNTAVPMILRKGPSADSKVRHLDIRYYAAQDLVKRGEIVIEYCPSEDMIADILTKPLVGDKFLGLRDKLIKVN